MLYFCIRHKNIIGGGGGGVCAAITYFSILVTNSKNPYWIVSIFDMYVDMDQSKAGKQW